MPDIKTRDVVSGTIKAVDRSALAGQRMKDAYVQAKDKAEHSVYSSESNSEEYASERIADGASTVAHPRSGASGGCAGAPYHSGRTEENYPTAGESPAPAVPTTIDIGQSTIFP